MISWQEICLTSKSSSLPKIVSNEAKRQKNIKMATTAAVGNRELTAPKFYHSRVTRVSGPHL